MTSSVLVLGSLNLDLILNVPHLPRAGETMHAMSFERQPGGKGANQAAACAALGVSTRMLGRVGADDAGGYLRSALSERGVDVHGLRLADAPTGQAFIHVAPDGENTITLYGGANQELTAVDVDALTFEDVAVLLLQLEIPVSVNVQAAQKARVAGVKVILDPAPAVEHLPSELLSCVDFLTPNEHEAHTLTGESEALAAGRKLLEIGVRNVVLKRGSQGALLVNADGVQEFNAPSVKVISTVAAGDTFNAALAAALVEGKTIVGAAEFAVQVASLRVSRPPGYDHLPTRSNL